MKLSRQLKIDYAVVCDDVRIEISNKIILVGIYGGSILLNKFGVPLRLAVWFFGAAPVPGEYPIELRFRVLNESGKKTAEAKGAMTVTAGGDDLTVGFGPGGVIVPVAGPGKFVVQYRPRGAARWTTFAEKTIGPVASEQPQRS